MEMKEIGIEKPTFKVQKFLFSARFKIFNLKNVISTDVFHINAI